MDKPKPHIQITKVPFEKGKLVFALKDGRIIGAPLGWFPKLKNASSEERGRFEISVSGYGVHWPLLDEDLSAAGLLDYDVNGINTIFAP